MSRRGRLNAIPIAYLRRNLGVRSVGLFLSCDRLQFSCKVFNLQDFLYPAANGLGAPPFSSMK
jgi:hypothetical protein